MRRGTQITDPPDELTDSQRIAKVDQVMGNNLYQIILPDDSKRLVELPPKFRSTMWIRRGGYVVIDDTGNERNNKIDGEIIIVIHEVKKWMKLQYWPAEFTEKAAAVESDDELMQNTNRRRYESDED